MYSQSLAIPSEYNGKQVTSIADEAFICVDNHQPNPSQITIPSSITSIGHSAFSYCDGLTSITIPASVTYIGDSAFINCVNLQSVEFEDKVHTWSASSMTTSNVTIQTADLQSPSTMATYLTTTYTNEWTKNV